MNDLLNLMAQERAEELRLEPGKSPVLIQHGETHMVDTRTVSSADLQDLFASISTETQRDELERCGDVHYPYAGQNGTRFKVTAMVEGAGINLRIKNLNR